jgi:microsomal dipeptidase-like Zn-dependent dipeptidase
MEHIYQVLVASGVEPQNAFDSMAIGSDFDGLIEPIDPISTVLDYRFNPEIHRPGAKKLDAELLRLFREHIDTFKASQLEPEEIVRKIMRENTMNWLRRAYEPVAEQETA